MSMIKTADTSSLSKSIQNLLFLYDDELQLNIHFSGGCHINVCHPLSLGS